jgi:hypothetical protein
MYVSGVGIKFLHIWVKISIQINKFLIPLANIDMIAQDWYNCTITEQL